MQNIHVLDCTLRDGGYVNNWEFGEKNIKRIAERLCDSAIEYIECGFLSETKSSSKQQSIFQSIQNANEIFSDCSHHTALMVNCGEVKAENIPLYDGGKVSLIRIAFHKHQKEEAQDLCSNLKYKGYSVFFQPMVTMSYSDQELLDLIQWANNNEPDAFYIVDSFGTMRKNDVMRFFYLIDNNLNPEIKIGFHSHNNLQLSFSNAQELMMMNSKRDIIIDSSVFGMGRGAGNLCTELLTQFINENIEKKYDLIPILEIMDEYIMPIYSTRPWGYSAPYYIAAINNCHPNYATFLMNKQTLCIRDINTIIKSIPEESKRLYNVDLISELYRNYQQHNIDDSEIIRKIKEICDSKKILILAPGKSLATYSMQIKKFIIENSPVIFAINHIPEKFPYDIVFISNLKRFKGLDDAVEKLGERLICTSNISTSHAVNYSSYLNEEEIISDNAGLMLINVLKKADIHELYLAGFDGFQTSCEGNYFDGKLNLNIQYQKREEMNNAIIGYFAKLRRNLNVNFLTPTIYDTGDTQ